MKLPSLETTKNIANLVVARTVSGVVVTVLHQNVHTETKNQKVQLAVGAYLIGSMVADRATDHVNEKIDKMAQTWNETKKKTEKSTL